MIWLALAAVTALLLGFAAWRAAPSAKAMRHDWAYQSCGGVESRHADDGGSPAPDAGVALKRRPGLYPSDGSLSKPADDLTAGVAPGPQDLVERDAA